MMLELKEQMKEKDITPAHIYLAVGSAGMLAGTVLGAKLIGLETKIHGIPVLEADAADLKALTVRLAAEARERFDIASQPVTEAISQSISARRITVISVQGTICPIRIRSIRSSVLPDTKASSSIHVIQEKPDAPTSSKRRRDR